MAHRLQQVKKKKQRQMTCKVSVTQHSGDREKENGGLQNHFTDEVRKDEKRHTKNYISFPPHMGENDIIFFI